MAITYSMKCPMHLLKTLSTQRTVERNKNSKSHFSPIFYCDQCDCFYIHDDDAGKRKPTKDTFEGKTVWASFNTVRTTGTSDYSPSQNKSPGSIQQSVNKSAYVNYSNVKSERSNVAYSSSSSIKPSFYSPHPTSSAVRIHVMNADEEKRNETSWRYFKNEYKVFEEEKISLNEFITRVFPNFLSQECVFRNVSFVNDKGNLSRRITLYNLESSYLKSRLPENTFAEFTFALYKSELCFAGIKAITNPIINKEADIKRNLTFYYDGPKKENCIYEYTQEASSRPDEIQSELVQWNEYLDWKKQLAELRIKAIKYIGYTVDTVERQMIFLTVTEGVELKDFKRYLRKNEISIFSNNYSSDRFHFSFNREYQDTTNDDPGIPLNYVQIGETYQEREVDWDFWLEVGDDSRKIKSVRDFDSYQMRETIRNKYTNPVFTEIIFDLSSSANDIVSRQMRNHGYVSDSAMRAIVKEFYSDGFIATSQIGDFALIKRLKNGIRDLTLGKSASQNLDKWLFDITMARATDNVEEIRFWKNSAINDVQKDAVRKILSVPDVCLIQGPPGTGKTTVIAEAIYQFAIRNKRVLVASQANLAVDNALERLISDPNVRAIRLGNSRKIDSSVNNITEANVLQSFYESMIDLVKREYLDKWERDDILCSDIDRDIDLVIMQERKMNESKKKLIPIKQRIDDILLSSGEGSRVRMQIENNIYEYQSLINILTNESNVFLASYSENTISAILDCILPYANSLKRKNGLLIFRPASFLSSVFHNESVEYTYDNLRYAISNIRRINRMLSYLSNVNSDFVSSEEIENLQRREKELMSFILEGKTEGVIDEYREVRTRLDATKKSSFNVAGDDKVVFDFRNVSLDKRDETARNILIKASGEFNILVSYLLDELNSAIQDSNWKLSDLQRETKVCDELQNQYDVIAEQISTLEKTYWEIGQKYQISDGILSIKLLEKKSQLHSQAGDKYDRKSWEPIFRGLVKWVDEIPDYAQEKEVYLKDFINGCNVVGVSCTENARTLRENGFDDFDVVIIDEVSKATPPELLLQMIRGRKIVLVGDHRQLPPLFNEHEKTYLEVVQMQEEEEDVEVTLTMEDFNRYKDMVTSSLFKQYFEHADSRIKETLTIQYRMHKDIMDIVNVFYNGKLEDGNACEKNPTSKSHNLSIDSSSGTRMIQPEKHAYWFDSSSLCGVQVYEQRQEGSTSAENIVEAEAIVELLKKMEIQYQNMNLNEPVSVGVISFYFDQVAQIKRRIQNESFYAIDVEVATVDRFQGKEKNVILVSLVRNVKNSSKNANSYIAAYQRINVAFSRAQNLLIILGATNMYAEQPVVISDMDTGEEQEIKVYKDIISGLYRKGAYFSVDEILPRNMAEDIIQNISPRWKEYK